ncbi:MAG: hypothetical protein A3J46_02740 [Candidatus Yanofskybacteria bacterium RIFCSPHIGHO2_02_FULL_41_11]|uniref:Glycoside hydrolase family 42 N-terminal domain-containing protein n=1 Tax=Candidatus Yanofskybacteria bacterium RIFCSPHIGHO2_02_FULL_41_11 TaxID=1802675 RepID=A0A1F8FAY1_9BACT|nr:MAG: hypothetical protein A3J46_02740 [Candidatus Yanofskybacteria bacterium RIFCSPHIGHO2_02_FULL_41_11]
MFRISSRSRKILIILGIIGGFFFILSLNFSPRGDFVYGVSFSRFHADELGLDWEETYLAILNDLNVKNFRFSAHWPLIEPEPGKYNFSEFDFQMAEAKKSGASVILAVGRRLPGWPECHEPQWVQNKKSEIKNQKELSLFIQERVLKYIETVVGRYKSYDNIIYWQIENEPFLTGFSRSACGPLDKKFLAREIELVKKLDSRPVLITDSGELSDWFRAYSRGDAFGTSLYLYIWPGSIGFPVRYPITPAFFRIKHNLVRLILGVKTSFVIELSTEPWLLQPITETPINVQLDRMGVDKFNEMIDFSSKTGFNGFYLWGAEWWYWLKLRGYPDHWDRAKELFVIE